MMHTWRYTGRLAVLAIAVACAPLGAQQTTPPTAAQPAPAPPAANPADVASPEALITALYDVISGPASQDRDWNRFRSLYRPDARLSLVQRGPAGQERLHSLQVEDFIRAVGPSYHEPGSGSGSSGTASTGSAASPTRSPRTRRASPRRTVPWPRAASTASS